MSEQGEVEVLMPVTRLPQGAEMNQLTKRAFFEAHKLIRPTGGRILGVSKIARAIAPHGEMAVRFTFAATAPEQTWHHRNTFAVDPT